ncbi:MAG: hypothetical protein ACRELE_03075, partial [Gemmatimonadales bacterium]
MPRSVRAVDALAVVAFLFGSHPVAAQEPAAYVAKPEFVLDGSRHKLSGSYWLGVRSDGSLVSEPIGNQNVEFLAASGERLSFAQPGASAAVVAAGFIGDTVWGRDPSSSTVTLISPELKVVRTISVPSAVTLPSGDVVQFGSMMGANPLLPVAIEPDGSFLVSTFGGRVPVAWHRPPGAATSVLHISAQGLFRALIGWTNITDSTCNATMGVFCGRAPMAIASDGHAVAFVHPSVAGADSGTFTVAVIKPTGDTVYARRYPFVARPASRHDVDSVVDGIASRMRSPNPVWIARVKA